MKRNLSRIFVLVLTAAMLFSMVGCGGSSASKNETSGPSQASSENTSDDVITLTYASFYSSTHEQSILTEMWIEAIEERTNGRVQIDYYPGESMVAAADTVSAVQQGIVDIGIADILESSGVFPAMSVAVQAWGYPDGYVSTKVVNDYVRNFSDLPEFSNMHWMYSHTVPPIAYLSTKEVRTYDDFKGAIARSGAESVSLIVKNIGAQAYSCSITELYEALSKQICDAAITGWDTLDGFNLSECVRYIVDDPNFGELGLPTIWMNKDKWDALPADIQEIITETNEEWTEYHAMVWKHSVVTARESFLAQGEGREVVKLSAEDSAKVAEATAKAYEEFNTRINLSAEELAACTEFLQNSIAEWSAKTASDKICAEWYEANVAPRMIG